MTRRLEELDGFRAIAILAVLLFHYFQRFPQHYPFGDDLLPFATQGRIGVDIFFMISGFVITLTLRKSPRAVDFFRSRLLRLWPAMLICATLTFGTMWMLQTSFTAERRIGLEGFLPSLTFTPLSVWRFIFPDISYIDGSYWSLSVEVIFYLWTALLYFGVGKDRFVESMLVATLVTAMIDVVSRILGSPGFDRITSTILITDYAHLFCAGVLFSALYQGRREPWLFLGLLLCAAIVPRQIASAIGIGIIWCFFGLFILLVWQRRLLRPFRNIALTRLGYCSYPLYLLHQNIGVAMIALVPEGLSDQLYFCAVGLVMAFMIGLAMLVSILVEQPVRSFARRLGRQS